MEKPHLSVPNNIVFCERRWKLVAAALGTACLLTFVWAFYILGSFLHDYDLEDYAINTVDGGMAGMVNAATAGTPPFQQAVASAVVSIVNPVNANQGNVVTSGTIVHPEGYVITTLHAIENLPNASILVHSPTGVRNYKFEIIKTHKQHDLVLLKMVTRDRFLYLRLADTQQPLINSTVYAFGKNGDGSVVSRQGFLDQRSLNLQIGGTNMTHLMHSDAIISWQQGGGPLINDKAELVGINLVVSGAGGTGVTGYAIPSHVIHAHFKDVVRFTGNTAALQARNAELQAAANQDSGLKKIAAAWWGKARELQDNQAGSTTSAAQANSMQSQNVLGMNVAAPPLPQVAHIGSAGDMVSLIDLEHETAFNIGGYKLDAMFGLAFLGLLAGIVGALMPMGGSILVVTGMMLLFGYGLYLIRPVIYITNLFTYGIAASRYIKAGLVMRFRVRQLLPWVIGGTFIGYFIGHNLFDHLVGYMLGVYALIMAATALYEIYYKQANVPAVKSDAANKQADSIEELVSDLSPTRHEPHEDHLQNAKMGAPLGLLTGILGVSGGVVEAAYQRHVSGIATSNALANSVVMVFFASLTGAIVSFIYGSTSIQAFAWQTPLALAMVIIPCTFAGGLLGAKLRDRLSLIHQRWIFALVMIFVALAMLLAQ